MINHYLLTIRRHAVKDYVSEADLTTVISYLKLKIDDMHVIKDAYEIDSLYQQLHWHGWVTTNSPVYYSSVSKYNKFRIYWRRLGNTTNILDVLDYLSKQDTDPIKRSQILDENYYRSYYGF